MKSLFQRLINICFLLLIPIYASASSIDQLKNFSATAHSASGTFTQSQMKSGRFSRNYGGNFVFLRPGKFIWRYTSPYSQLLQSDGNYLYIYDKDLNQVTIRKLGAALGSNPAAILFGSRNLEQHFKLKNLGTNDGCEWVQVTPRSKNTSFERINIGMKNGFPRAMELYDTLGNKTVVDFSEFKKNPAINIRSFKFSIPKGADVYRR